MSDNAGPSDVFREEAAELLEELESSLIRLGDDPTHGESLNAAFRALHTIKGSGAMFDFTELVDFAHRLEASFVILRDRGGPVPDGIVDAGLAAVDLLRSMITGGGSPGQRSALADRLDQRLRELVGSAPGAPPEVQDPRAPRGNGHPPGAPDSWLVVFEPSARSFLDGTNLPGLIGELRALGALELACSLPEELDAGGVNPEHCLLRWKCVLPGSCSRQDILDVFMFIDEESRLEIEPQGESTAPGPEDPSARPGEGGGGEEKPGAATVAGGAADTASIKVRTDRLDRLVNLVGELVSLQGQMSLRAGQLADRKLLGYTEQLEGLVREARGLSMDMHMVPVERLFGPFRRHVRGLARDLGREVRLQIAGSDTELDRNLVDQLRDPLLHLVRNAIDHGIEAPEERIAAGKARAGSLRLSADYAGALVRIRVQDDGRGLDRERILARARERGLLAEHAQLTEHEIADLVFAPGFSTAAAATAVSGRGVGMDVVRRNMEALGGAVSLRDAEGGGTLVEMRIPLTLAIVEGLLAEVHGSLFLVKLEYIRECREDSAESLIQVRGGLVPVVRLADFFELEDPAAPAAQPASSSETGAVIVVEAQEQWIGLRVDRLIGTQQSVVKPLGALLSGVEGVSGAIFLSDGRPGLLLDVERLARGARDRSTD